MKFKDYFSKNFETSDNNFYETLRTRYYRARIDEAIKALKEVVTLENAILRDENTQYNEFLFETSGYSCIAKITPTSPVEMAIDFKVITFNIIGMGKGKKVIEELYRKFDAKLSFKGIGLYKG